MHAIQCCFSAEYADAASVNWEFVIPCSRWGLTDMKLFTPSRYCWYYCYEAVDGDKTASLEQNHRDPCVAEAGCNPSPYRDKRVMWVNLDAVGKYTCECCQLPFLFETFCLRLNHHWRSDHQKSIFPVIATSESGCVRSRTSGAHESCQPLEWMVTPSAEWPTIMVHKSILPHSKLSRFKVEDIWSWSWSYWDDHKSADVYFALCLETIDFVSYPLFLLPGATCSLSLRNFAIPIRRPLHNTLPFSSGHRFLGRCTYLKRIPCRRNLCSSYAVK